MMDLSARYLTNICLRVCIKLLCIELHCFNVSSFWDKGSQVSVSLFYNTENPYQISAMSCLFKHILAKVEVYKIERMFSTTLLHLIWSKNWYGPHYKFSRCHIYTGFWILKSGCVRDILFKHFKNYYFHLKQRHVNIKEEMKMMKI